MTTLRALGLFILMLVILAAFYDFVMQRQSVFGFGEQQQTQEAAGRAAAEHVQTAVDVVLSALAIVAGIVFGSVYTKIRQVDGPIKLRKELAETFHSSRFLSSILIAPLIFAGVYVAAKTQPDRVVAFLFAFQNGFFCESIFRRQYEPK